MHAGQLLFSGIFGFACTGVSDECYFSYLTKHVRYGIKNAYHLFVLQRILWVS